MTITFWGAARTVTGSMHLLEIGRRRLLLDCGLFQGPRKKAEEINRTLPFDASLLDAVVLSHAHIDHAGLLPRLERLGFNGRIYATPATTNLCRLMLADSAHIQTQDAWFVNKKHAAQGLPPVEELYDIIDVEQVMKRFVTAGYGEIFSPLEGVEAEFRDAGHILGSATVNLELREGARRLRLGFTGDIGRPGRPILRDPQKMRDCDVLLCESTYGGLRHEPGQHAAQRLEEIIGRTIARGGKVIIPAFSVDRTQEVVHTLDRLWNQGRLPLVPVFVDSPMATNATEVYRAHPECYDADLHAYMMEDPNPFGFERLTYVRSVEQSKALNDRTDPMIIISASGMCEAGRILHHLRNNVHDARTTILMVGFCAEHTLGARLLERPPKVRIFGQEHVLKAEVVRLDAFSGHADETEMLTFLGHLDRDRLRHVHLVHGNYERQQAFQQTLRQHGYTSVSIPERGTTSDL